MRLLCSEELLAAEEYLRMAVDVAMSSTCFRSKSGCVIMNDGELIGSGYNSPPNGMTLEECFKDRVKLNKDRTCCVHAEQRAIFNALRHKPVKLPGSSIYYVRLDLNDNELLNDDPDCSMCSKVVYDVGISEFIMRKREGVVAYSAREFNDVSFGL
jgi:deoxycytidylate deaminase